MRLCSYCDKPQLEPLEIGCAVHCLPRFLVWIGWSQLFAFAQRVPPMMFDKYSSEWPKIREKMEFDLEHLLYNA
jgi:hypothetical protein